MRKVSQWNTNTPLDFIAQSAASLQTLNLARRVASFKVATLITGETGTGKECIARIIHHFSSGNNAPYVAVNCAAIPETMLESTLFGYEKGAFTGAVKSMPGKFELANNGTLLLDEIGDMPLTLQAKLLRVLQEQEVERLGSNETVSLNIRIIAATNKDLQLEMREGRFREDLYYRLSVVPVNIAPLRERPEDIIPLAQYFINKQQSQYGDNKRLSEDARYALLKYDWPGNVRELENVIQRGFILSMNEVITAADIALPVHIAPPVSTVSTRRETELTRPIPSAIRFVKEHGRQAEYQYIIDLLKQHNGNKSRTAQSLGITPRALRYRLASMRGDGIDPGYFN
ncbi:AAA domain-containing protein [Enterobacteriaceae bacterium RIT714]|nr:AAA domain-containing protein [Enterobacteriaceae bacterium RIT714]